MPEITHEYPLPGSYTVVLEVTDEDGAKDTVIHSILVGAVPPVADAGPNVNVVEGQVVWFNGSGSSDADGHIVSYAWDWGNSVGVGPSNGVTPSRVFGQNGTYLVNLTVTDNSWLTDWDTLTVSVANAAPVVDVGPSLTRSDSG